MKINTLFLISVFFVILIFPGHEPLANEPMLERWESFSRSEKTKKLLQWLRCQAKSELTNEACLEKIKFITPDYFGRLGVFVTLKNKSGVRGCYGSFVHSTGDIERLLFNYLDGALTQDPRYKPLEVSELEETEIILTITSPPYVINDIDSIDLEKFGVVITCGEASRIFVPAEIKSISYLRRYIKPNCGQISVFRAVTIRESGKNKD